MDPFTLFTLASGAVQAVKKGCELYKEIKGTAGNVKEILKDLDKQFFSKYPGGSAPKEAVKQFNEEKARIKEVGNKNPDDIYAELGEQLGVYYENYAKCKAIFLAEEKHAEQVYDGEASIGKRALQRVLMRKKLEQMGVELREVMVYHSPPELGALYTEVSEMMEKIMVEQAVAVEKQVKENIRQARIRKEKHDIWLRNTIIGLLGIFLVSLIGIGFALVVEDRIRKYPHLGTGWIPRTEEQRRLDSAGYRWVGR